MSSQYLITGVTGGLGGKILDDLLHVHKVKAASIIATSSSETNRERFESQGLHFKVLDYNQPETLRSALQGVKNFLFMSSSQADNAKRNIEHHNAVEAAKTVGVEKVWYISLAFGGFGVDRKVSVQQVHNETEEMLIESGLDFVSLRAGVYADAFPLFLNWYPSSKAIHLPNTTPPVSEGRLALTARDELGEGIATLLSKGLASLPTIKPKTDRNIILLTAADTVTFVDIANIISSSREQGVPIEYFDKENWIDAAIRDDEAQKPRRWFETRFVWFQEMANGSLQTTDSALETLLGRKPESGVGAVERLIGKEADYTWHQNYSIGKHR